MAWNIKAMSACCAATGLPFSDGDNVVSLIFRTKENEILRADVLDQNLGQFICSGELLGQWKRTVLSELSEKDRSRQQLFNQEEFFFSLYDGEPSAEKDILKQLLSLLLEKKRILRSFGDSSYGMQNFIHIKTKRSFRVPVQEILPEELTSLENVFEMLI